MVSTTEKYALEIEIFALSMGFWAQISRSDAQKRRFQRSVWGQSGRTDFFNRIGRFLPLAKGCKRPKLRGHCLVKTPFCTLLREIRVQKPLPKVKISLSGAFFSDTQTMVDCFQQDRLT